MISPGYMLVSALMWSDCREMSSTAKCYGCTHVLLACCVVACEA